MLDVKSNSKGLLVPRLTELQRSNISNPATGLMVFQTDGEQGFYYNVGTPETPSWLMLSSTLITQMSDADNDTKVQVEKTSDEDKIHFDVAGSESMTIDGTGNVGIGNNTPSILVDVKPGEVIGTSSTNNSQHDISNRETKVSFGAIVSDYPSEFAGMTVKVDSGTAGCGNRADIVFNTWECNTDWSREIMRIHGNGNIGIDTINPSAKLHVNGDLKVEGRINGSISFNSLGNVAITDDNGHTADESAMLDVYSTDKGFLPPRMTTAQRDSIDSPVAGLVIYNTDENMIQNYNNTLWINMDGSPCVETTGTISGDTSLAANATGKIYSIAAVNNADNYTWTVPAGASITSGQGTTSITVNFGGQGGNVSVTASNTSCGASQAQSLEVDVFTCGISNVLDPDGRGYRTVLIGNQCWMAENYAYLPQVDIGPNYKTYYVYDYTPVGSDEEEQVYHAKATLNYYTYGVLYNWWAAMDDVNAHNGGASDANPSGVQGICPDGWHLPSSAEWTELIDYAGGTAVAGAKLKATGGWYSGNGTDDYNFRALPGGINEWGMDFVAKLYQGWWWSSSQRETMQNAYYSMIYYDNDWISNTDEEMIFGCSVRCVKD
jgi:uncharacterized protein (TIGR02145 family)